MVRGRVLVWLSSALVAALTAAVLVGANAITTAPPGTPVAAGTWVNGWTSMPQLTEPGNRVLNDGLGPSALARFDRDVLAQSGVEWLVVFEGVNDLGTADPAAQPQVADDLIAAYEQFVVRAHAHGIDVFGATLLPFGGNTPYDDPAGARESARQTVNQWIRHSGVFDAVMDFDRAVRDPATPRQLLPAYDVGDHLHLNPTGYRALADAVPAHLFR